MVPDEKSFLSEEFDRKQQKNNTQKDEQQRWLVQARLFLPPTTCEPESSADEYPLVLSHQLCIH